MNVNLNLNIYKPMTKREIKFLFVFVRLFFASLISIYIGVFSILIAFIFTKFLIAATGIGMTIVGGILCMEINRKTGISFSNMDDISVLQPDQAAAMNSLFNENPELTLYRQKVIEFDRPFYRFELVGLVPALNLQKEQSKWHLQVSLY